MQLRLDLLLEVVPWDGEFFVTTAKPPPRHPMVCRWAGSMVIPWSLPVRVGESPRREKSLGMRLIQRKRLVPLLGFLGSRYSSIGPGGGMRDAAGQSRFIMGTLSCWT